MTVAPLDTDSPDIQRLDGRLRDLLAGKKIVMTGVTGFIGEQLLWKILTELPDTTPAVLVRRKGSATARDRLISTAGLRLSRAICPTCPSCLPIWTSWCIAPVMSPSTHRSTRR